MRATRILTVVALATLSLALLRGAVHTAAGSNAAVGSSNLDEPIPVFTRVVTITIQPSDTPLTPGLTSLWQVGLYGFPGGHDPVQIVVRPPFFPTDTYDLVFSMTGGLAYRQGITLFFNITGTSGDLFYNYRSDLAVAPTGGTLYPLPHSWTSNGTYRYISTVYFTQPYQYATFMGYTPTVVNSYTLNWNYVPPYNEPPIDRYRFESTIWLADPRPRVTYLPIVLRNF